MPSLIPKRLAKSTDDDDFPSPPNNKKIKTTHDAEFNFTGLPAEALRQIIAYCTEHQLQSMSNVVNACRTLSILVAEWQCKCCEDKVFVPLEEGGSLLALAKRTATPFSCGVCKAKFCGIDSQQHFSCRECGKLECVDCSKREDCVTCINCPSYRRCASCWGDCQRVCDVCNASLCVDHASTPCAKCGVTTCSSHNFAAFTFDSCDTSLCDNCNHNNAVCELFCHICLQCQWGWKSNLSRVLLG